MRPDMFKVIVERPRLVRPRACGSAYPRGALRHLFERDLEHAPKQLGMAARHREKWLNENLAPLERFLRGRVGRPWNKVRGEIAEHLSVASAVQKHVLDHLKDFVAEHVRMVDGVPHDLRWGVWEPVGRSRSRLWVCPRTGLLRFAQGQPRRTPPIDARRVAVVDDRSEVWRIGGALSTVRFARLPAADARPSCFDVIVAAHLTPDWFDHRARLHRLYGRDDRYAASKRDVGRRELALVERTERPRRARR